MPEWAALASQNHFMLGQINEWFFNDLVGIMADAEGAGFRKPLIKPEIINGLEWVKGSYQSVSGLIVSAWKREGHRLTFDISIPVNTTATVFIPGENESNVWEGGKIASGCNGVKFLRAEMGKLVYEVESGNYQFMVNQ